jgi:hypothetical protein
MWANCKSSAAAAKLIEDFLPIVTHLHLKDYVGGRSGSGIARWAWGRLI